MFIGLDFGTTNSALSVVSPEGPARLVPVHHAGATLETFRSILYFDNEERDANGRLHAFAGPAAMDAYLDRGAEGRLIQSVKSYLANPNFTATNIFGTRYTLENLVGFIVTRLIEATAEANTLSEAMRSGPVVVGRPARFVRNSLGVPDAVTVVVILAYRGLSFWLPYQDPVTRPARNSRCFNDSVRM